VRGAGPAREARMKQGPSLLWRLLPKRFVSRCTGLLSRMRAPGFVLRPVMRLYGRTFGVDYEEMGAPLASYRSFRAFFTRPLKPGARPQSDDPAVIGSPADGRVCTGGTVTDGTVLQAKGVPYTVADLLGSEEEARPFEGGSYLVVYLAPGDYHRFHWPFDGRAERVRHVPGQLWSVDAKAVRRVDRLYVRNERIVVTGRVAAGGAFAYVPVGAMNVGSIRLAFHDVRTEQWRRRPPRTWDVSAQGRRGDEFGLFELGSTIVLLLAPEAGRFDDFEPDAAVRVGQRIGRLD
jgi:phosphatidylserine decarboxylase